MFREIHKHPKLVEFAMTFWGRVILWLIATTLLWQTQQVIWLSPLFACFLARPQWRRELLCIGSVIFLYQSLERQPNWDFKSSNRNRPDTFCTRLIFLNNNGDASLPVTTLTRKEDPWDIFR